MREDRTGVLFVCLGNICRSPLAEGVFRRLVREAGLEGHFHVDSAGTLDWHVGEPPDARTLAEAERRGVVLESRARRIEDADLSRFDYVITMDRSNLRDVLGMADGAGDRRAARIRLLRDFDPDVAESSDVPDPYFGGERGFERVHDIVERSCRALLGHVRAERGI